MTRKQRKETCMGNPPCAPSSGWCLEEGQATWLWRPHVLSSPREPLRALGTEERLLGYLLGPGWRLSHGEQQEQALEAWRWHPPLA